MIRKAGLLNLIDVDGRWAGRGGQKTMAAMVNGEDRQYYKLEGGPVGRDSVISGK